MSIEQAQRTVNQIDKDIADLEKKMADLVKKKLKKQRKLERYNVVLQKAHYQVHTNQKCGRLKIIKRIFPE